MLWSIMEKMLMILIFALVGLSACGQDPSEPKLIGDQQLIDFVHKFKEDAYNRGREFRMPDLELRFEEIDRGETIGYCRRSNTAYIAIDIEYWNKAEEGSREALMYHELGHCVLNLGHSLECRSPAGYSDNCYYPTSIMYPKLINGDVYEEYKDYYLQELFKTKQEDNHAAHE